MDVLFVFVFILLGAVIGAVCIMCIALYKIHKEYEFIKRMVNGLNENYKVHDYDINENRKTLEFVRNTLKILLLTEHK